MPDNVTLATPEHHQPAIHPVAPAVQAEMGEPADAVGCMVNESGTAQPAAQVHATVLAAPPEQAPSMQQGTLQATGVSGLAAVDIDFAGADSLHSLPSFRIWGGAQKDKSQGEG